MGVHEDQARSSAANHHGRINLVFSQPEGWCTAFVAMWLRGGAKHGAAFWTDAKRFTSMPDPALQGVQRYVTTDRGDEKARLLFQMEPVTDHEGRSTPAAREQSERLWVAYIEAGLRPDKPNKAASGRLVCEGAVPCVPRPIAELGALIDDTLGARRSLLVGLSGAGIHHAVGFDGSDGQNLHYFDPKLGEFTFASVAGFLQWFDAHKAALGYAFTHIGSYRFRPV